MPDPKKTPPCVTFIRALAYTVKKTGGYFVCLEIIVYFCGFNHCYCILIKNQNHRNMNQVENIREKLNPEPMVNDTRKPWAKPELHILNHKKTYGGLMPDAAEDEFSDTHS